MIPSIHGKRTPMHIKWKSTHIIFIRWSTLLRIDYIKVILSYSVVAVVVVVAGTILCCLDQHTTNTQLIRCQVGQQWLSCAELLLHLTFLRYICMTVFPHHQFPVKVVYPTVINIWVYVLLADFISITA